MPDRSVAPTFVAPQKFKLQQPEIIAPGNGARFFFLQVADQPVIKLEFIFRAGTWFESKPGAAFFTSKMLLEGTNSFSSQQIAEKLEQYGAFVDINPGFDYVTFSIHVPTQFFQQIRDVIREILFSPTFPEHELKLMKDIQLEQLKVNQKKNKFAASRLFRSNLFNESPYGHVMDENSIEHISIDDLTLHYQKYIQGKYDLFLTGGFDNAFKEDVSGFFQTDVQQMPAFVDLEHRQQAHFNKYEEREEALQSSIFMGHLSINRTDPDYARTLLLNEVFGGYFGSRLMQNIREDKGLTYGIYSHLVSLKNNAYFVISSDVKKEKLQLAIDEIHKEIERLKTEPVGANELQQVKNYLKGSIRNTLTTPFAVTDKLKNLHLYDLGVDFYDRLFDEIDETASELLLDLANNLLFKDRLSQIVVG